MLTFFKQIFVWWNQQTLGTRIQTILFGKFVGKDSLGNKYYENKNGKRWVIYNSEIDATKIPDNWYSWMHHTKNKIERYLGKKLDDRNKKYRLLYMLNKIGYDIRAAKKDKKKYYMLIKAYQMHYRQSLISGKLDLETYNLILSHYNEMLTKDQFSNNCQY